MIVVFFFLCEHVTWIQFSIAVEDGYGVVLNVFAYAVFVHLEVAEAFGGHVVAPFDGGVVVVVYWDGARAESFVEA